MPPTSPPVPPLTLPWHMLLYSSALNGEDGPILRFSKLLEKPQDLSLKKRVAFRYKAPPYNNTCQPSLISPLSPAARSQGALLCPVTRMHWMNSNAAAMTVKEATTAQAEVAAPQAAPQAAVVRRAKWRRRRGRQLLATRNKPPRRQTNLVHRQQPNSLAASETQSVMLLAAATTSLAPPSDPETQMVTALPKPTPHAHIGQRHMLHTLTGHTARSLFSGTSEDAKEDATAGTATESGWTHALERSLRPVYTEEVRLIHKPRTPLL